MIQNEKFEKMCKDFLLLDDNQQDYILGILQALVFAKNTCNPSESEKHTKNKRVTVT
jgi:hypothetical protein